VSDNATRPRAPHLLSRLLDRGVFHTIARCPYETDINELIDYAEGRDLAKHLGCIFTETSTKQPGSVDQAFDPAVRKIRKYDKVCLLRVNFEERLTCGSFVEQERKGIRPSGGLRDVPVSGQRSNESQSAGRCGGCVAL
jgi:hypothetical protein